MQYNRSQEIYTLDSFDYYGLEGYPYQNSAVVLMGNPLSSGYPLVVYDNGVFSGVVLVQRSSSKRYGAATVVKSYNADQALKAINKFNLKKMYRYKDGRFEYIGNYSKAAQRILSQNGQQLNYSVERKAAQNTIVDLSWFRKYKCDMVFYGFNYVPAPNMGVTFLQGSIIFRGSALSQITQFVTNPILTKVWGNKAGTIKSPDGFFERFLEPFELLSLNVNNKLLYCKDDIGNTNAEKLESARWYYNNFSSNLKDIYPIITKTDCIFDLGYYRLDMLPLNYLLQLPIYIQIDNRLDFNSKYSEILKPSDSDIKIKGIKRGVDKLREKGAKIPEYSEENFYKLIDTHNEILRNR